ncbi:MAG TPA: hypothetical protein VF743_06375, partial [Acidimicrobiales bacterium]
HTLGAVLPDLASMARVRPDRERLPAAVRAGVRCHVVTDAAFHAHPAFRSGAAALRDELVGEGLAVGPARAVGHVGWELLLDGTLVGGPDDEALSAALGRAEVALDALDEPGRRRWRRLLAHRPLRLRYDDPWWIAERLVAILGDRPRLRVPPDRLPTVGRALERHAAAVAAAAAAVLADTSAAVRARPIGSPGRPSRG